MKPDRPGFYWYRDEPAKVWKGKDGVLCYDRFIPHEMGFVADTNHADWGPEIKGDGDEKN